MRVLGDLRRFGDAPALLSADRTLTYSELVEAADEMAAGWGPGRHLVLIACASTIDTVVAQVAAFSNGHPAILVSAASDDLIGRLTEIYQPDIVITPGKTAVRGNTPPPMHPDLAVLLLTSGSTGSSKLVRLSHRNLQANTSSIIDYLGMTSADRAITSLPVFYGYGLSVVTTHLESGGSIVMTEDSVADPCFWDLASRHRVTSFSGVPYTFELIDQGGLELPDSLRFVTMSGGHSPVDRVLRWASRGKANGFEVFSMYGSTEATSRMTYVPPALLESAPDAIGIPMPGGEIRLEPVPESKDPGVGEIVYRGDNVMMGYAEGAPDLAAGALLTELRSGDLARLGGDGLYRWTGRRSRIAKVFGLRIDLGHLERSLASRGITAACVDAHPGIAVFVTSGDEVLDAVVEISGLPRHSISVRTIAELPKTAVGKVDVGRLRHLAGEAETRTEQKPVRRSPEEAVRDAYALVLHRPDATMEDSFTSLAGDSLSYVELSTRLANLNVETSPGWQHQTIAELASTTGADRRWIQLDSTILLRAVAITLIVAGHTGAFVYRGGAHVLLAVAGYNFARFQLGHAARSDLWRSRLRSLAHVMAPAMAWIIAVSIVFGAYDLDSILLIDAFDGDRDWSGHRIWFIDVYFWIQALLIVLLAVPAVDRWERRRPFHVALSLVAISCVARFAYTGIRAEEVPEHAYLLPALCWLFAVGWAAAKAPSVTARLGVTTIGGLSLIGFFADPLRGLLVFAGLVVLIWVPFVAVPRFLARPISVLASASLFIYVSHFQFFPAVAQVSPWLAVVAALAFGIVFERAWWYGLQWLRTLTSRPVGESLSWRDQQPFRPQRTPEHGPVGEG